MHRLLLIDNEKFKDKNKDIREFTIGGMYIDSVDDVLEELQFKGWKFDYIRRRYYGFRVKYILKSYEPVIKLNYVMNVLESIFS